MNGIKVGRGRGQAWLRPFVILSGTAKSIDLTSEMDPHLRGDAEKIMISDGPTRSMGSDRKARPAVHGALADR